MSLRQQLEEIQILQCSLLPSEIFAFVLPPDDNEEWTRLVQEFTEEGRVPSGDWQPGSTCRFEVRVQDVPIWFEVELPRQYPERAEALVYVKGDSLQRGEQERLQSLVKERMIALKEEGTEFTVQTLLCVYVIPLLHDEAKPFQIQSTRSAPAPHLADQSSTIPIPISTTISNLTLTSPPEPSGTAGSEIYHHVLFTSHHLVSPTKRRNMQKWSGELPLRGFAKVGYPGVIYAEGTHSDIAEFVSRVKAMQWLALKVRFEEHLDLEKYGRLRLEDGDQKDGDSNGQGEKGKWVELEKVGEVVELMRRSGRDEFVTEMGLGSSKQL